MLDPTLTALRFLSWFLPPFATGGTKSKSGTPSKPAHQYTNSVARQGLGTKGEAVVGDALPAPNCIREGGWIAEDDDQQNMTTSTSGRGKGDLRGRTFLCQRQPRIQCSIRNGSTRTRMGLKGGEEGCCGGPQTCCDESEQCNLPFRTTTTPFIAGRLFASRRAG